MAMDIEVVHKAAGTTRFEKAPALLVGLAAVVASLLGTLEVSANKRQEQAQAVAVRLTVQAFGTLAGSAPRPPPGRHTRPPCPTPTCGPPMTSGRSSTASAARPMRPAGWIR